MSLCKIRMHGSSGSYHEIDCGIIAKNAGRPTSSINYMHSNRIHIQKKTFQIQITIVSEFPI